MEVVQVYVVALQASQALLAGAAEVGGGEVLSRLRVRLHERDCVEVVAHPGGDDKAAAAPAKRLGQQLLAVAAAVDIRRFEERDAKVDGAVEQGDAVALVAVAPAGLAQSPQAEADDGDVDASVCDAAVSHDVHLWAMRGAYCGLRSTL